jgi:hypothetical protein
MEAALSSGRSYLLRLLATPTLHDRRHDFAGFLFRIRILQRHALEMRSAHDFDPMIGKFPIPAAGVQIANIHGHKFQVSLTTDVAGLCRASLAFLRWNSRPTHAMYTGIAAAKFRSSV